MIDDFDASDSITKTVSVTLPWVQVAKLTADDAQISDLFGFSVSVDGDTALVGAVGEDSDGTSNAGSAYVFS